MVRHDVTRLTDFDLHLFNEGRHHCLYDKLGAHLMTVGGETGAYFAVWAPNANYLSVIGDFNHWNTAAHPLAQRGSSGIWEGFIPGVGKGFVYKYHVGSRFNTYKADKMDPLGFYGRVPPETGSKIWPLDYSWGDADWMAARRARNALDAPMSIYEVHLGSWMRVAADGNRSLSYRELADKLPAYVKDLGFTHVELLPVMEHPFFGSWGYQVTGFYSPSARYGEPQEFMRLIDRFHQAGIGVILDWVPSHFPNDIDGLCYFDGTHLYEHADERQGFHPEWKSLIFNYGRNEVRSFLISNALFWLDKYHADGLRVDAVASMLYLDYGRKAGEWVPNKYGGKENIDAIHFMRQLNQEVYTRFPDTQTIAEESTSWALVSKPPYVGGLGFGLKWDMGWMHDTLRYMAVDPVFRRYHHNDLTFRMLYAHNENFVLPLSHDEVVHMKSSLLGKMPGDPWQKLANLRLMLGYMYAQSGKKLLFMGGEIGQWGEWNHDAQLDWPLLDHAAHQGVQRWVRDLNRLYRAAPALSAGDFRTDGFEWIDCCDTDQSVLSLLRRAPNGDVVVIVCNFTPVPRTGYRIGLPSPGPWRELLNSDSPHYGGSGVGNLGRVLADETAHHGRPYSAQMTLPPLGVVYFGRGE